MTDSWRRWLIMVGHAVALVARYASIAKTGDFSDESLPSSPATPDKSDFRHTSPSCCNLGTLKMTRRSAGAMCRKTRTPDEKRRTNCCRRARDIRAEQARGGEPAPVEFVGSWPRNGPGHASRRRPGVQRLGRVDQSFEGSHCVVKSIDPKAGTVCLDVDGRQRILALKAAKTGAVQFPLHRQARRYRKQDSARGKLHVG